VARERKIVSVFGAPGMGKSALAKSWLAAYQQVNGPDSVRALDPSRTLEANCPTTTGEPASV
jgi:type IV secretory pathway VirB4 component